MSSFTEGNLSYGTLSSGQDNRGLISWVPIKKGRGIHDFKCYRLPITWKNSDKQFLGTYSFSYRGSGLLDKYRVACGYFYKNYNEGRRKQYN